jgi:hypothetical protein
MTGSSPDVQWFYTNPVPVTVIAPAPATTISQEPLQILYATAIIVAASIVLFFAVGKRRPKGPASAVSITSSGISMEDLERISKLKSMLDNGAISKDEFETQKRFILHASQRNLVLVIRYKKS